MPKDTKKKTQPSKPTKDTSPSNAPPNPFPVVPAGEHSLESLRKTVGAPDKSFQRIFFRHAKEDELADWGKDVDSSNVVADIPRFAISALAILARLEPARRSAIKLPPPIFAVLVDEALTLDGMKRDHDTAVATGAGDKVDREAALRNETREGIALRDQTVGALYNVVNQDQKKRLDTIKGDASSPDALATGMNAVAEFIEKLIKAGDEDDLAALEQWGVAGPCAAALREKAPKVQAAGKRAAAAERRITQRGLDIQDGRVLWLVDAIWRAFKLAQRSDPALLMPELSKLAWIFESRSGAKVAKPPAEPAPKGDT